MSLFGDDPATPAPTSSAATPYRVLARKYRPTRFEDLIGQEVMVRILRRAFATNRVAHAFMLTGVRGVGKTTTARIIARCLNCTGPDGAGGPTAEPCGVCPDCVAILADRHPDVTEMDAASRTGVDDVREIIEATRFRPLQARTKVFIVDEVHMLSRQAFNALLKTLEEPPPTVKFVFATTELRKVPVTVLSRCQRFDLRRVSVAELAAHYARVASAEGAAIEDDALSLIARAADGSVRDGLSLLDQAIAQAEPGQPVAAAAVSEMLGTSDRDTLFDLLDAVFAGEPATMLAITERAHERGTDLGVMLGDLLDLLHTLTRLKTVPALREGRDLPEAERTRGGALADRLDVAVLGRAWQMLLKGIGEVEQAPDRRAAAEMVLIRLCYVADLPTPAALVRELSARSPEAPAPPPGGGGGGRSGGIVRAVAAAGGGGSRSAAAEAVAQAVRPMPVHPPASPTASPPASLPASEASLAPLPRSLQEVAALVAERREASLHAHLVHSVHIVRFAPPVIEFRPEPDAPRDLASRLAACLNAATGLRWTIAVSSAEGEPTLADRGAAAHAARREAVADHPLVRAILEVFPGATIDAVRDERADAYGLVEAEAASEPDNAPAGFALPDGELMDEMPDDEQE